MRRVSLTAKLRTRGAPKGPCEEDPSPSTATTETVTSPASWIPRMFTDGLVNLYTRDIEGGIRFYRDILGFKETFRTPKTGTPTHVEFKVGPFTLGLGTVEAAKRVHGVDALPGSPAMAIVFWTDDVDREIVRLRAAGVTIIDLPHDTGNNNRNASLRDPDGNVVEIVSKRAPTFP